ncbi:MAG: ORF6N domain-containing protein [Muribaculaceae bacterium]|nr:ORF6N domain-containing protein [Muribaculaceae bacterium]
MNELQTIQSKIYEIRGQKVMLDRDLAELYGVETSQLKRAVRRNIGRFEGDDFMFELTKDELSRCQIGILKGGRGSNVKYLPFAFTELGVAMLSSVLRSETAIEINRGIMRAFVTIRQMITDNSPLKRLSTLEKNFEELKQDLEDIFADYNDINEDTRAQIEAINTTLAELQAKPETPKRPRVGFNIDTATE